MSARRGGLIGKVPTEMPPVPQSALSSSIDLSCLPAQVLERLTGLAAACRDHAVDSARDRQEPFPQAFCIAGVHNRRQRHARGRQPISGFPPSGKVPASTPASGMKTVGPAALWNSGRYSCQSDRPYEPLCSTRPITGLPDCPCQLSNCRRRSSVWLSLLLSSPVQLFAALLRIFNLRHQLLKHCTPCQLLTML